MVARPKQQPKPKPRTHNSRGWFRKTPAISAIERYSTNLARGRAGRGTSMAAAMLNPMTIPGVLANEVGYHAGKADGKKQERGSMLAKGYRIPAMDPASSVRIPSVLTSGEGVPFSNYGLTTVTTTGDWQFVCLGINGFDRVPVEGIQFTDNPLVAGLVATFSNNETTSVKQSKFACTILNETAAINAGGKVGVWIPDQRIGTDLAGFPNVAAARAWAQASFALPYVKPYNGSEFKKPKRFLSHVVDDVSYSQFSMPSPNGGSGTWCDHYTIRGSAARPMAPIVILVGPQTPANTYTIKWESEYMVRYSTDDARTLDMKELPTATPQQVNAIRRQTKAANSRA